MSKISLGWPQEIWIQLVDNLIAICRGFPEKLSCLNKEICYRFEEE